MINAIIFDMDGTLIDSEPYHERVRNIQLKKLNALDKIAPQRIIGTGKSNIYRMLFEKLGLNLDPNEWAKEDYLMLIELVKKEGIKTNAGLYEFFEYAKSKGIKMAIGSSSDKNFVEFIYEFLDFDKYISVIITKDDVERAKPAPDIFLKSLEKLGVKAEEALVIEDAESGLLSAKNANIRSVFFDGGESVVIKQDSSLSMAKIKDFRELIDIIEKENS